MSASSPVYHASSNPSPSAHCAATFLLLQHLYLAIVACPSCYAMPAPLVDGLVELVTFLILLVELVVFIFCATIEAIFEFIVGCYERLVDGSLDLCLPCLFYRLSL